MNKKSDRAPVRRFVRIDTQVDAVLEGVTCQCDASREAAIGAGFIHVTPLPIGERGGVRAMIRKQTKPLNNLVAKVK